MFVKNNVVLVVADEHRRVLVGFQLNEHVHPRGLHLVQRVLDLVLLGGTLADLLDSLDLLLEVHFQDLRRGEVVDGRERDLELARDLLPVAVAHTWVAQRHNQRHLRHECHDLLLDGLSDVALLGHVRLRKVLACLVDGNIVLVYLVLNFIGIKIHELASHPGITVLTPVLGSLPQVQKGLELLDQAPNIIVIREVLFEKGFARIIQLRGLHCLI